MRARDIRRVIQTFHTGVTASMYLISVIFCQIICSTLGSGVRQIFMAVFKTTQMDKPGLCLPHFRDDEHETQATTMKKPKKIERIIDDSMKTTKVFKYFSKIYIL